MSAIPIPEDPCHQRQGVFFDDQLTHRPCSAGPPLRIPVAGDHGCAAWVRASLALSKALTSRWGMASLITWEKPSFSMSRFRKHCRLVRKARVVSTKATLANETLSRHRFFYGTNRRLTISL
jgi:hypothetical protein